MDEESTVVGLRVWVRCAPAAMAEIKSGGYLMRVFDLVLGET